MKTLKYEEVLRNEYRDLAEARASIREFRKRSTTKSDCTRHSAICRRSSSRLNWQRRIGGRCAAAYCMSFTRHGEIYPCDGRGPRQAVFAC